MTLGGTDRIMRRLCTTLRMSAASLLILASISPVISGGARSFSIESCPSSARDSADSAPAMSSRAESTTATSSSVMPPRAETMAIVGMGPECPECPECPASPSEDSTGSTGRPALSRRSRSPTVLYRPASASDAPPNLWTSQRFAEPFGDVTLEGQTSEECTPGGTFVDGLLKDTDSGPAAPRLPVQRGGDDGRAMLGGGDRLSLLLPT
mmetsp:Transcript_13283/g.30522  ORF Transcript_13283/g.30522 Transcript_13283/m.30522 type:complete len:209 (+) Transcript_13283:1501-2127(+)